MKKILSLLIAILLAISSLGNFKISASTNQYDFDVAKKYYLGNDTEKIKNMEEESILNNSPKRVEITFTTDERLDIMKKIVNLVYQEVETPNVVSIEKMSTVPKSQGEKYRVILKVMNSGKAVVVHKLSYEIFNPSGEKIENGEGVTNAKGKYLLTYNIPEDAPTCQWKIVFVAEGETPVTDLFTVKSMQK